VQMGVPTIEKEGRGIPRTTPAPLTDLNIHWIAFSLFSLQRGSEANLERDHAH